jgi:hypothetical protein
MRASAEKIGGLYNNHRRKIIVARNLGLKKIYNLFHNPDCKDYDTARLLELHAELNLAIFACYGWNDLDPAHDFFPNERGQIRFKVSHQTKREIIRRLLDLNKKLSSHGG